MNKKHILIVEDEIKIAELLQDYLTANGYQHSHLDNGIDVVDWVKQNTPDAILLDLMLPSKDGISICQEIRQFSHVPIIMITAKIEEIDRILGLEIGANDYICKPFSPREVIARLKSLFRLLDTLQASNNDSDTQSLNGLTLLPEQFLARFKDTELDLTPVEFRLLLKLSKSPRQVFSRQQLVEGIYDDHRIITDRTIDTHIKNLRKKLTNAGAEPEAIRSVYGIGYKWDITD
jgi:two-component system response regulator BaeR